MTYKIREDYEPTLYVGREEELELAQAWWKSTKRLLSISAPPATGKTWFLRKVHETFKDEFKDPKIVTFWLDVGDLLLPPGESIARTRKPNPELVKKWLKKLIDEINKQCSGQLEEFTFSENIAETIERVGIAIGNLCQSSQGICIFIDDGDQFDDSGWREFERWFLEPFVKEKSLRFVIAVREKRAVETIALRLSENRIKLTTLPGEEQIARLLDEKIPASSATIRTFISGLQDRGYQPTHPGINKFLVLFAEDNPQIVSQLDVIDNIFGDVLEAVNPHSKDEIEYLTVLLHGLSTLADEWDIEDLVETFQISRPKAWDYLQVLEDNALITRPNLNRYKIVEGIRGFTLAVLPKENILEVEIEVEGEITLPRSFHYKMDEKFSVEELEELCFNMSIEAEQVLLGERRLNKIINLIQYCGRYDRLTDLINECQRLRPNVDWLQ